MWSRWKRGWAGGLALEPVARTTKRVSARSPIWPTRETSRAACSNRSRRARPQPGSDKALASLDPRSRRIIEARWLREQDAATLHELADEFGVSAERIRQIEAQAMKKMRAQMVDA